MPISIVEKNEWMSTLHCFVFLWSLNELCLLATATQAGHISFLFLNLIQLVCLPSGFRKANLLDGNTLCKFGTWIKRNKKKQYFKLFIWYDLKESNKDDLFIHCFAFFCLIRSSIHFCCLLQFFGSGRQRVSGYEYWFTLQMNLNSYKVNACILNPKSNFFFYALYLFGTPSIMDLHHFLLITFIFMVFFCVLAT